MKVGRKLEAFDALVAAGFSRTEAGALSGLSSATIIKHRGRKGQEFDSERVRHMAELYRDGKTLEEIGLMYGVTRERIRQLLKRTGITANDGGQRARARGRDYAAVMARRQERDADAMEIYGCSYDEVIRLNDGLRLKAPRSRAAAYARQRLSAKTRDIPWNITFSQWCAVWAESGKWELRGRGKGRYCMSRYGDQGPYEIGNVKICLTDENISESYLYRTHADRAKVNLKLNIVRRRQEEVLAFSHSGMTNDQIAEHLGIAATYVSNLLATARRRERQSATMATSAA